MPHHLGILKTVRQSPGSVALSCWCRWGQLEITNSQDRFVTPSIAKKFDFEVPEYKGIDQVVEVEVSEQKL
jgi:hypothetical protein